MTKPLVHRVATRIVRPEWATRVVSPAYDSVRPEERAALMDSDPYVFLHVTRSPGEIDGHHVSRDEVAARNAAALAWLLAEDVFSEVREPGMFIYRLRTADHEQIGVVTDIHLSGVEDGRIGPHERIQPHRAVHLADHISRVAVNSSPVAFGYDNDSEVDSVVASISEQEPILDFERGDHLHQTIWQVPEAELDHLESLLGAHKLYVIDGHHRVAAGLEHWKRSGHGDQAACVLGALFPMDQLKVSAFHRRVGDLNGLTGAELCDAIAARDFSVRPLDVDEDPTPIVPGSYGMYVDGQWYEIKPFRLHPAEFDATVLQDRILGPILDVEESASAGRLEYLPGTVGLGHLVHLTDGGGGVAFALHPVQLSQLKAVVDRGQTLPPKSTYFEPKVRSGLFVAPR